MSWDDRPPLRPIGPVLKEVRLELGVSQRKVAEVLGFGGESNSKVSLREKDPDTWDGTGDKPIEPRPDEIARFEDHFRLQRGTILRRAGYVVDADSGMFDQIDSWSTLPAQFRELLKVQIETRLRQLAEDRQRRGQTVEQQRRPPNGAARR